MEASNTQMDDLQYLYGREIEEISVVMEDYWNAWQNGKITKNEYDEKYKIWNDRLKEATNKLKALR